MTFPDESSKAPPPAAPPSPPDFFSAQVAQARRFYLDLRPRTAKSLSVVCGGVERSTPDYLIKRSTFPYFSIEYVLSGRGRLKLNHQAHTLEPGAVFSYGPGISQEICGEAKESLVKYFVDFSGRRALALLESCRLRPGRVSRVFPASELQGLFDELIRCGLRAKPACEEICARLLECIGLKIAEARASDESGETLAFLKFRDCQEHIQHHFLRLKTLQQISAECHINNAYLCRLFRRYDRQSPYQFLLRLKMNSAAELLAKPGSLVKQVAEATGFSDPFHFSRAFKAVFGVSPDVFRKLR